MLDLIFKRMGRRYYWILVSLLWWGACSEEKWPTALAPTLSVKEATKVTRNTAQVTGMVTQYRDGTVTHCYFLYGRVGEQMDTAWVKAGAGEKVALLTGLMAGTEYVYCLEASNGYSVVRSEQRHLTTEPNTLPVVGDIELIYKGPFRVAVQGVLKDDGGEVLTFLGFACRPAVGGVVRYVEAVRQEDGVFQASVSGLDMNTRYVIRARAVNRLGEMVSDSVEVVTDQAIYLREAGLLAEIIGEEQKYNLTTLSIAGKMNGSDVRWLREMLGRDAEGKETPGRLCELDLSDAKIVAGGGSYYASRYTAEDTLGYGFFADCADLRRIVLPNSLKVIEQDAFRGCSGLVSMGIPDSLRVYYSSEGCAALESFSVSVLNSYFSSRDGVLYDKKQEKLIRYPEGKMAGTFSIPESVTAIAQGAFVRCPLDSLVVPRTVKHIGEQAFREGSLQRVVLSDAVTTLASALFQGCTALREVTLGSGTQLLGNYCFDRCPLERLAVRATYPPTCYSNTFYGTTVVTEGVLLVPKGYKSLYRGAGTWKDFFKIQEFTVE